VVSATDCDRAIPELTGEVEDVCRCEDVEVANHRGIDHDGCWVCPSLHAESPYLVEL
jgi:hypothetical protein